MEVAELRTLDGPNLFMLRPAIKIELHVQDGERSRLPAALREQVESLIAPDAPADGPRAIAEELAACVAWLHRRAALALDELVVRTMEEPGCVSVAYAWERRHASRLLGRTAWGLLSGEAVNVDASVAEIRRLFDAPVDPEDVPEVWPESRRSIPTIGITGTNGKTTTTRLVASILRNAGHNVGWTSSAGVVINGDVVLPGDYTGPSGAARVFEEPNLDYAVLETARGGILLRGLGYEHSDVSVMTNISADHMGMHGVHSLDVLTEVKAVVARVTRADGFAVLNADDSRVLSVRDQVDARPFLFSRTIDAAAVVNHVDAGGWALAIDHQEVVWFHDGQRDVLTTLNEVPITFAGRAHHMVENALAASAACLAIGLPMKQVRDGLKAFRNRPDQNRGRLNVYDLDGATVIVDFAHNEAGLRHLLEFGRRFCGSGGRQTAVIGTAGDREDGAITGIARIAAELADDVIVKDSVKYLRGRESGNMPALMRAELGDRVTEEAPSEFAGFEAGMKRIQPGDVLSVMCIEDSDRIIEALEKRGRALS